MPVVMANISIIILSYLLFTGCEPMCDNAMHSGYIIIDNTLDQEIELVYSLPFYFSEEITTNQFSSNTESIIRIYEEPLFHTGPKSCRSFDTFEKMLFSEETLDNYRICELEVEEGFSYRVLESSDMCGEEFVDASPILE